MKKNLFILPTLALALFAACSGEEALTSENNVQQTTQNDAVTFDAYLNRTVTRAGWAGAMTTSTGEHNLRTEGFGVFAYYADGDLYSENAIPDFMYNQQVKYESSEWKYSPLKYWPNEFGSSAVSTGVDRVTFFAYAPYVAVDPATGQLTSYYDDTPGDASKSTETGITALTRNGKTGDPYVRYVGAFNPNDCVDLLYGVAAENFTSKVGAADGANSIKKGDPFINVAKPEIGARLKFDFKHALTKLKVQVDADVDVVGHSDGNTPDVLDNINTRIWIRSITFDGIAQRGYLNLNNGMWYEVINGNKISHASVTVHDGLRDGAEALAEDSYEAPIGINPQLRQSVGYTTTLDNGTTFPYKTVTTTGVTGVTSAYQNLFSGSGSLLVIPANEQLKVTIVYDVETADATLPNYLSDGVTKGSTVENRITKAITLGGTALKLDAGKEYTLNLHLGMTSVKFDAQVADWDEGNVADDTWLPINGPTYTAAPDPYTPATTTISAEAQTYKFAISGLDANEAVPAPTGLDSHLSNATGNAANASGLAVETIDIAANTTVSDRTSTVTWTGATSGKGVALTITQRAHELGLGVSAVDGSTKKITLSAGTGVTDPWSTITDATETVPGTDPAVKRIQVKKNGTALTGVDNSTILATNQFQFDSGTITLFDAPVPGDVFTITVNAGDADTETVTARIGAISYAQTIVPKANGGANFINPLTNTGTGTVGYIVTDGGPAINSSTGEVTINSTNGAYTVTATVANDLANGWFYPTNTATYTLSIGDVVFAAGGSADWNVNAAGGTLSLVICGLRPSGDVSVEEPLVGEPDPDNIASSETINDGVSGSTANKADANGIAHVTATIANNSETRTKQAILTVKNGTTEAMTITIKQASN